MNKEQLWQNLVDLRDTLLKHNEKYRAGYPDITDMEYDDLLIRYKSVVAQYYDTTIDDIDTEDMSSMNSAYDISDVLAFHDRICKQISMPNYVFEPKVDGVSILLTYDKGKLVDASCRSKSTNILPILLEMCHNLPLSCDALMDIPKALVKGELCIAKHEFKHFNETFVSARNTVAGLLMRKENKEKRMSLSLLVFDVDERLNESHIIRMQSIEKHFDIVPILYITNIIESESLTMFLEWCHQWDYHCDGLVIKLDDNTSRFIMKSTASAPRWAFALKYVRKQYECTLLDVEYDIGRTGRLAILGIVDTIIDARKIKRINMHGASFVKQNNIKLYDKINIEYRGDAVPIFDGIALSEGINPIIIPEKCMYCNNILVERGEHLFCINVLCSGRCYKSLLYQVQCLDIDMLGKVIIKKMSFRGIRDITDLEKLSVMDLASFSSSFINAPKIFKNIHDCIARLDANKILLSLGIPLLGYTAINKIAAMCKAQNMNLQEFINYIVNHDCSTVLGKKLCNNIVDFLKYNDDVDLVLRYNKRFGSLIFI